MNLEANKWIPYVNPKGDPDIALLEFAKTDFVARIPKFQGLRNKVFK